MLAIVFRTPLEPALNNRALVVLNHPVSRKAQEALVRDQNVKPRDILSPQLSNQHSPFPCPAIRTSINVQVGVWLEKDSQSQLTLYSALIIFLLT